MTVRLKPSQNKPELTAERLRDVLHYCPSSGVFTWLISLSNSVRQHSVAGCVCGTEHRYISIDGRAYLASRLAWLYMTEAWPTHCIDHINRSPADDRFCNLREATQAENGCNRSISSRNKSGYPGVFLRNSGRWRAYIRINGKLLHLGIFTDKADAIEARRTAEMEHFGEFAPRHDTATT